MGETCFLNSEMPKIVQTCLSINISTVRNPRSLQSTAVSTFQPFHDHRKPLQLALWPEPEGLLGMRRKLRSTFFSSEDLTKQARLKFRVTIFLSPSYLRKAPRTTQKRRYLQSDKHHSLVIFSLKELHRKLKHRKQEDILNVSIRANMVTPQKILSNLV